MADKCPLGEDCDLTLAYMMGAEKAKDLIVVLRRENERLRAALEEVRVLVFGANRSEARYPLARAALTKGEKPRKTDRRFNNAERIFGDD